MVRVAVDRVALNIRDGHHCAFVTVQIEVQNISAVDSSVLYLRGGYSLGFLGQCLEAKCPALFGGAIDGSIDDVDLT
eukprot:COSAG01_NODE_4955_length_4591_cov_6.138468_6_plen_77_part_00